MIQRERDIQAAEAALKAKVQAQEAAQRAQEAAAILKAQEAKDLATYNANKAFLESLEIPYYLQVIIQEEGLQNACVAWSDGVESQEVNGVSMQLTGIALLQVTDYSPGRWYLGGGGYSLDEGDSFGGSETWHPAKFQGRKIEFLGNTEHGVLVFREGEPGTGNPPHINVVSNNELTDPGKTERLIAALFLRTRMITSPAYAGWAAEPYESTIKTLASNIQKKSEPQPLQPPKKGFWERLLQG